MATPAFTAGMVLTADDMQSLVTGPQQLRVLEGATGQSVASGTSFTTMDDIWTDKGGQGVTEADGAFTIAVDGWYRVEATLVTASGAGQGTYQSRLAKNGTAIISAIPAYRVGSTGSFALPPISALLLLEAEDVITLECTQNSGSAQTVGIAGSSFQIAWQAFPGTA